MEAEIKCCDTSRQLLFATNGKSTYIFAVCSATDFREILRLLMKGDKLVATFEEEVKATVDIDFFEKGQKIRVEGIIDFEKNTAYSPYDIHGFFSVRFSNETFNLTKEPKDKKIYATIS